MDFKNLGLFFYKITACFSLRESIRLFMLLEKLAGGK